jgi:hypothetical protein
MSTPGTSTLSVERLCRRVGAIPSVFVEELREGQAPLATHAILHDLVLVQSDQPPSAAFLAPFRKGNAAKKTKKAGSESAPAQRYFLARVLAWLLMDDGFRGLPATKLEHAIQEAMNVLSVVAARQFLDDTDRREELVRLVLRHLELAPEGEAPADAEDRLSSLDSVRRVRLLQEARAAEDARRKREAELAAELAKKQAEEQAARYDREY